MIALVGIIAAVYVISSGAHALWGLLIMLLVVVCVLLRPRVEHSIVERILAEEEAKE